MAETTVGRCWRTAGDWGRLLPVLSVVLGGAVPGAETSADTSQAWPDRAAASAAQRKTRFSIRQEEGAWWLVSPQGQRFFSLGVCCVDQGYSRKEYDPENPGYAAWQHYGDAQCWATATSKRLKSWGFTTVGAWSDHIALRQSREMTLWMTPIIHLGATAGAPWWDMWDPKVIQRMENVGRDQILAVRDDPRLLGYYSDNELGWWNASLFKMTLEQPSTSGQRKRLLELLRDSYAYDWQRLLADFEPENASNWEELQQGGTLFLRTGGNGIKLMRRFLGILAERYYQLVHRIIRKYDPQALILGDRYQSFYYPEVAKACAPYVDAISSNLNASWSDGTFIRCYLETLHALTGKPILISEFYLAARENSSGNKNSQGLFPVVATQKQRAACLRASVGEFLRLPQIIGADWFQYHDEPRHGREDGENFNFGLVDIFDQPYSNVTAAVAGLDVRLLKGRSQPERTDASCGVPPAPEDPLAHFEPMQALQHWDRERGFVKATSAFPLADLYVCWSPEGIYLGLYAMDIVEEAYYRNRSVPKNDRPLWTVAGNGHAAVQVRLGAEREPIVSDPEVRVQSLSCHNQETRNVAIVQLPASHLGLPRLKEGDILELSSTLWTHGRAYQVDWKGKFTLAGQLKSFR
jgi:hypothetical protein